MEIHLDESPPSLKVIEDGNRMEASFCTKDWSAALAGQKSDPEARAALEIFSQTYWIPGYAAIRRWGKGPKDTETTEDCFFWHLLDETVLPNVRIPSGKFSNLLVKSLNYFLLDEHAKQHAKKRVPAQPLILFFALAAKGRYRSAPVDQATPDELFDLRWVQQVLKKALTKLRYHYIAGGKGALFDELESV